MLYMVTFTINIPPMLAYIPYMDPMGLDMLMVIDDPFTTFMIRIDGKWVDGLIDYYSNSITSPNMPYPLVNKHSY